MVGRALILAAAFALLAGTPARGAATCGGANPAPKLADSFPELEPEWLSVLSSAKPPVAPGYSALLLYVWVI